MVTTDQLHRHSRESGNPRRGSPLGNPYRYSHTIGLYSLLGRGFNNPVDMAFGKDGVIYVLNRAGPEVSSRMSYKRVSYVYRGRASTWVSSAAAA